MSVDLEQCDVNVVRNLGAVKYVDRDGRCHEGCADAENLFEDFLQCCDQLVGSFAQRVGHTGATCPGITLRRRVDLGAVDDKVGNNILFVIEVRHAAVSAVRQVGIIEVLDNVRELALRGTEASCSNRILNSTIRVIFLVRNLEHDVDGIEFRACAGFVQRADIGRPDFGA